MASVASSSEVANHLVLDGVTFREYWQLQKLLEDFRLRITYDRASLEITTISPQHRRMRHLLTRIVNVLADVRDMDIASYGSMTITWKRHEIGLEPDNCFWFANEAKVRCRKSFNWDRDPPPELVLEIDLTKSSLDRIAIYETMGVQEVWRWTGKKLEVRVLTNEGKYTMQSRSKVFPDLRPADLLPFVQLEAETGERGMLKAFRAWLAEQH